MLTSMALSQRRAYTAAYQSTLLTTQSATIQKVVIILVTALTCKKG